MNRRKPIGEILRTSQKDEEYSDRLRSSVNSLGKDIFGAHSWLTKERWVDSVVKFTYYSLTTLADFQTLGEEYTGVIQCTNNIQLPSKLSRFFTILLKSFGPNVFKLCLEKLQIAKPETSGQIETLKQVVTLLENLHTSIFYFQGLYFEITKRLTGIQYVKTSNIDPANRKAFRVLGYIASINLVVNLAIHLYRFYKRKSNQQIMESDASSTTVENSGINSSYTCAVCLEPVGTRGCAAATFCGHLGCWTCLLETATISRECPLCRTRIIPNKIIPLQNL